MLNQFVGVGRLVGTPEVKETEDGEKRKSTQIVAEKITFLSSNKEKDDEVEKDSSDEMEM